MSRAHQFLVLILVFVLAISSSCHALVSSAKVTIKVVNEDGSPVEGARVGIGFDDYRNRNKENSVVGLSNDNGLFSGSAATTSGAIGFNITKQGYYKSTGEHLFKEKKLLRWEPWNQELRMVLRKIGNPVPMYARDTVRSIIEIPVVGKNVGFDLIAFDWVKPYGNGEKPDFIFHLERLPEVSRKNYAATLTITFPNKYDGLQKVFEQPRDGSAYKLPRFAPEAGYEKKLVLQESFSAAGPIKLNFNFRDENINYIFRVRSVENDGEFVKAMYGKVIRQIDFSAIGSKTAKIYFNYYLNPDYTRNLEFDTKHNLFGELPDLEKIRQP